MPPSRPGKGDTSSQIGQITRKNSQGPPRNRRKGKSCDDADEEEEMSSPEDENDGYSIQAELQDRTMIDDEDKDHRPSKRSWQESNPNGTSPKSLVPEGRPIKRIKLIYRRPTSALDHVTRGGGTNVSNALTMNSSGSTTKNQPASSTTESEDLRQKIETLRVQNTHHTEINEHLRSKLAELTCKQQDMFWRNRTIRETWNRDLRLLKIEKKLLWECGIEWARREQLWALERQSLMHKVHELGSSIALMMTQTVPASDTMVARPDDASPHVHPSPNQHHL